MNNSFNDKKIVFIINIAYIIAILFVIYVAIKFALPIVFPFIIAVALCYIVEPTVQVLNKKAKLSRSIASVICIVIVVVLLFCVLSLLTTTLYNQIKALFSSVPDFIVSIDNFINEVKSKGSNSYFNKILTILYDNVKNMNFDKITSMNAFDGLLNYFTGIFKSIPNMLLTMIVTFVFTVFLSSSFVDVKSFLYKKLSNKNKCLICQIKNSIISVFKKYLKSYFALMMITFSELCIAFAVFGIKPVFSLAFIISIIDILPMFGVGTVMIPWSVVLFVIGEYNDAMIILSIYAVITVVRQIVEPKVVGSGIGLPPVVTLPAMYIGLRLFGVIGLFISPLIITVIIDLKNKGFIKIKK